MDREVIAQYEVYNRQIHMKQQKQQPLYFYAPGEQNLQKTLGKKQPLNPYKIIPQIAQNNTKTQVTNQTKGKFYYDHLIPDEEGVKSKGIKKPQKRKNYKTKMCPHGRECRHKISCTFAHTENQLRKPFLKRTKPCKIYQLGQCQLGSACRQYHGNIDLMKKNYKYKVQYCKDFVETGKCDKGRVCIFIHELPPQQEHQQIIQQQLDISQQSQKKNEAEVVEENSAKKYQVSLSQPQKQAKQIVQVIQEKIGAQEVLEGGLSFNFSF